ncbi:hypothetical protein SAMN04487974_1017 [Pelagibacterium luteolum]|uniref:Uncharacterized protein n=1 Tax=Pelagibacterium luteolum TaxID=440168 RepID=A0A1G7RN09_9HYPH|nr:hypothetical protein SAMN04487974_1017 [Pelagibacterium luteolum]
MAALWSNTNRKPTDASQSCQPGIRTTSKSLSPRHITPPTLGFQKLIPVCLNRSHTCSHGRTADEDAYELPVRAELEKKERGTEPRSHRPSGAPTMFARPVRVRWGRPAEAETFSEPVMETPVTHRGNPAGIEPSFPENERAKKPSAWGDGGFIYYYLYGAFIAPCRLPIKSRGDSAVGRFGASHFPLTLK